MNVVLVKHNFYNRTFDPLITTGYGDIYSNI